MTSTEDTRQYEVLMSPLLSDRLTNMDKKLDKIHNEYININSKFDRIIELLNVNSARWDDNKVEYVSLLKSNKELSEQNMKVLSENRCIYTEKLDKIQEHNTDIINNIQNPTSEARRDNRYWRTSGSNTVMKPPASGIVDILWPWATSEELLVEPDSPVQ
tara:strand:- start:173 stop:652 length:480 start_codon:yes stop_codon:yes gene_type:complete